MRIARALALAGIASRRKCESYVKDAAVTVNGEVVTDLGRKVNPERDCITFYGRPLRFQTPVYYVLYKPEGYTTTASDPHAMKTVYELLPKRLVRASPQLQASQTRVFPVGRLDRDSSGLLLFTNDGELANRLTHPRYQVGKWYEVHLNRPFDFRDKRRLLTGIPLEEGLAKAEKVFLRSRRIIQLLICEGKKREIHRMFEQLDYTVTKLVRLSFGPLFLGHLRPGEGRFLKKSEVIHLKKVITKISPSS